MFSVIHTSLPQTILDDAPNDYHLGSMPQSPRPDLPFPNEMLE